VYITAASPGQVALRATPDLQRLVDDMSVLCGLPVVLTTREMGFISASVHDSISDENRQRTILERKVPDACRALTARLQVHVKHEPFRIQPHPKIGMRFDRWAIPLLHQGILIAYFWILGPTNSVPNFAERIDGARALVRRAERAIEQAVVVERPQGAQRHTEVEQLVSANRADRALVLRGLQQDGFRVPEQAFVAVLRPSDPFSTRAIAERMSRLGCRTPVLEGLDEIVVLGDATQADRVHNELHAAASGDPGAGGCTVGVSRSDTLLDSAPSLLRNARFASVVARLPEYNGWANWNDLGMWTWLESAALSLETVDSLCPGIRSLEGDGDSTLRMTALAYLESNASVVSLAAALSIHRSTLYYRLGCIESLLGADWNSGWRRTGTHAALKLWALLDLWKVPTVGPVPNARFIAAPQY
jgi:sugar diacid utilization regulator